MCVAHYVACGGCNARASDAVVARERRTEYVEYPVTEDGEQDTQAEPEYGDADYENDGFYCSECGWTGMSLDMDCIPDDCDCAECDPRLDNFDETGVVHLTRTSDSRPEITHDPDFPIPPEIVRLLTDRSILYLPITVERAIEIEDECYDRPVRIDLDTYADEPPQHGIGARLHALATDLAQGQTTIEEIAA